MSRIITDPTGLVKQPHDPYWDGPITRREVQGAVNVLANNDSELFLQATTARLIMNLYAEKLNITPAELQAYIDRKKAEINAALAAQEKATAEASKEGSE